MAADSFDDTIVGCVAAVNQCSCCRNSHRNDRYNDFTNKVAAAMVTAIVAATFAATSILLVIQSWAFCNTLYFQ